MKILLTGVSGNLGSHLKRANQSIMGVSRNNWKDLDCLMASTDIVVHSAYDLKNSISQSPAAFFNSNLLSTMQLLESMVRNNVSRLYFISSCAVYGDLTHMSEESACSPVSINGIVKYLNEKAIREFCTKNQIEFTFLRLFNLYGGNDQFSVLHHLSNAVHNGAPFYLNNDGVSQRDFIYVDDAARIILKLIDLNPREDCINIGTGTTVRIVDLLDVVLQKYPSFTYKKIYRHEIEYARADISKLNRLVEYKFEDVLSFAKSI